MSKRNELRERYYPLDMHNNDSLFLKMIEDRLGPESHVLDAGAGAGDAFPYEIKGKVTEMVGIDLDPRVTLNPRLDRGIEGDLTNLPFPDSTFDLVFSRYVLEHVTEPTSFAQEISRVLKPGGQFLFLTPSKWHYVALIARLTPNSFHDWYNEKLRGRKSEDTFPTTYFMNAQGDLRRVLGAAGFTEEELIFREVSPNYLLWSKLFFFIGMLYERLVNRIKILAPFRVNILGAYKKQK